MPELENLLRRIFYFALFLMDVNRSLDVFCKNGCKAPLVV